jgi:formylglycine-generating enzyme required for sulfatase activity
MHRFWVSAFLLLFLGSHADVPAAAADALPAPGTSFRDCEKCPEMMAVPPGSFQMGASAKEKRVVKYVDWALPQHPVTIGYAFAIGRYEVTVDEFDAYVKESGAKVGGICSIRLLETGRLAGKFTGTPHPNNDARLNGPYVKFIMDGSYAQPGLPVTGRQPAVCVSRNEIKGYLDWLSKKTGHRYRLPTEAEWEYAYRAGSSTINFWGDDFARTCEYANFGDRNSGYQAGMMAPCAEKIRPDWTADVGSYKPNPWGLYDMTGNAQETVEDCFHTSYKGAPADGSAWTEANCLLFVARGGDYELPHLNIRASDRLFFGYTPDDRGNLQGKDAAFNGRSNVMGFRVVRF